MCFRLIFKSYSKVTESKFMLSERIIFHYDIIYNHLLKYFPGGNMNKEVENYLQKIGLTDDDIKRLVKSEKQKTASMCYAVNEYDEYL